VSRVYRPIEDGFVVNTRNPNFEIARTRFAPRITLDVGTPFLAMQPIVIFHFIGGEGRWITLDYALYSRVDHHMIYQFYPHRPQAPKENYCAVT
jgi:hypothetical protein